MSDKFPFAVLAVHPNSGIEILTVLAQSHKQALTTAASVCIQRHQPDLSIVAALSLGEISNIQKILERAEFIGEGNGLRPDEAVITAPQLEADFEDAFEESFDFYEEQNSQVEQRFPTRNRDLYDLDVHGTPQPKGTVAAASAASTKKSQDKKSQDKKPVSKTTPAKTTPKTSAKGSAPATGGATATAATLDELDLSQGHKTNDGKSDVFLDDYYNQ